MARTDDRCSIQSPSLDARMRPSKISVMSMYDNQNVERLPFPPLRNLMSTPNSYMIHVHEPVSRTCLRDSCVTSSKRLSMILKFSSMWTTSSAWVASSHHLKPMLLFVVVVFILLFLLTRSNRLQPIVIQFQRFLAITTVSCCMGHVCALVSLFTACQFVYTGR